MTAHRLKTLTLRLAAAIAAALTLAACANPGSGPDGGPYDETPPKIVAMSPAIGQTDCQARKVTITFDEFVKIENAQEKIVVSPPQIEMPDIKTSGRRITVELLDSLRPETTYTVDFSDAIADANEGNPLGNFTYYFSTGPRLDTMEVAGNVLAAANLEPVKGILVGLHSDTTDTAFSSKPFDRVARTDSRGRFCIKGVAPGTYRAYALKDMDGDFRHSPGETLAVLRAKVVPASFPDVRQDTLWRDSTHYDTVRTVHYTHYVPDDLVLLAYDEADTRRHFLKAQRDVPEWFRLYFTAPSARTPLVRGLNFNADSLLLTQANAGNDTVTYWLRHVSTDEDTLRMAVTFEAYDDSLLHNVEMSDTLELIPRETMARRLKQEAEELEKWEKRRERRHKRGDYSDEIPPRKRLPVKGIGRRGITPAENIRLEFEEPLARVDTARLHFQLMVNDTLGTAAPMRLKSPPGVALECTVMGEWRYGQKYTLTADSAAFTGLSGRDNEPFKVQITVGREADYGALFLHLPDADSTATVQLLKSDTRVESQVRTRDHRADFFYLAPGTYYLRCFYDRNGNGRWDTGDLAAGRAPEEVYYFPRAIEVRANWDIEQTWRVDELPLTRQKPAEITKQKPEGERKARNLNAERNRQLGRSGGGDRR